MMDYEELKKTSISVLGFGWLGQALHQFWQEQELEDFKSFYSRSGRGISHPFELKTDTQELPEKMKEAEVIIVTLPPSRDVGNYSALIAGLGRQLNDEKRVVLISTTSVFEMNEGTCSEETVPLTQGERAGQLYKVEKDFSRNFPQGLIIRSAGQIGQDRTPAKYLANKDQLPIGNIPVNVIHKEDLVRIISLGIAKNLKGILHAVSPYHPSKEEFYNLQAASLGLSLGKFPTEDKKGKLIESKRLAKLGYRFTNEKCDI